MQAQTVVRNSNGKWTMYAVPLSIALAVVVFVADLITPLGVASGVPYSLAVIAALRARSSKYILAFAILCSVLTIVDLFIGPGRGGSELWKVLTNRAVALCMIWITTTLGMICRRAEQQRREAEERTRLHLADLAHMSRVKAAGQFAANLAHELNQPLLAISIQSEFASHQADSGNKRLKEALSEITEQSQRAGAIIKTLRELVQKTEPRHVPLDLKEVLREVVRLIDVRARHADVKVQLELSETPPVLGDRIQLEQVLLNLLQNSLDAVTAAENKLRRIQVHTSWDGNGRVEVSVCDSGVGMNQEYTERVFERFYSTKPGGMGMGLAISRSIIEAHGGQLWATTNSDQGTTFKFNLQKQESKKSSPISVEEQCERTINNLCC